MDDELDFVPWWVRRQRLVFTCAAVAVLAVVSVWSYGEYQLVAEAKRCDPGADAQGVFGGLGAAFEPLDEPKGADWRAHHNEPKQCFSDWLERERQEVTRQRRTLYLQPIGDFDAQASPDLETLAEFGRLYFGLPVVVREPIDPDSLDVRERLFAGRGPEQWLTTDLLEELEARLPDDAYAMLGLTMTDLWPGEGWNFVFGQARLSERVGVYSFARYDPGPGLRPASERRRLILLRSMKVMSHETGHMFGITHCLHHKCNMNGSNSLAETDSQPIHLCPVDLRKLHHAVGFDLEERYRKLAEFYEAHGLVDQARFVRAVANPDG